MKNVNIVKVVAISVAVLTAISLVTGKAAEILTQFASYLGF